MRFCRILPLFLCAVAAAQNGVFKPVNGEEARWSINPNHVVLWNGTPYIPFGLRIDADEGQIDAAKKAGIQDLIVDCPTAGDAMKHAVAKLEANGLRYLLSINTLAPSSRGVMVEPQGNRFTGITAKRQLNFRIPGAEEALVVLAVRRDGTIQNTQRVKGANGSFTVEVNPPNDLEHVALIYPLTSTLAQLDAWEGFDAHRDAVLIALKKAQLGKGLRGILNPLGNFAGRNGPRSFVPNSRLFRFEYAAYLKATYRNPETCMKAWVMAGTSEKTFDQLARLVPLWVGARGVATLWDPTDNQLYPCDMRRSLIWRDIDVVMSQAEARRGERLITAIKRIADVPVIQEWVGWEPIYEGASHGLDGIGMRPGGTTLSAIADSGCRAASSLFRWARSGWLLATQIDVPVSPEAAGQFGPIVDDLLSMGVRGGFVRTQDAGLRGAVLSAANTKGADGSLAQWTAKPIYFPESAANPAVAMRLPAGSWWLPCPADGNRLDLGSGFHGYRLDLAGGSAVALWSRQGPMRVKLHMLQTKDAQFRTVDGSDPQPKSVKNGVEVNLTELPLVISGIDEIPIPEPAFNELGGRFAAMLEEASRRMMDTSEEQFLFRDHMNGYARNPGGNYLEMRAIAQKLSNRLSRYLWLEAETTRESNFSEVQAVPGISNGNALSLRTQLQTQEALYTADYSVTTRSEAELEVWIAARIGPGDREKIRLSIGGQDLKIEGEPVSGYGPGFAWYSLGKTRLPKGQIKVVLKVTAPDGADLAIDTLLFFPGSFRPNGIIPPDAITYAPIK